MQPCGKLTIEQMSNTDLSGTSLTCMDPCLPMTVRSILTPTLRSHLLPLGSPTWALCQLFSWPGSLFCLCNLPSVKNTVPFVWDMFLLSGTLFPLSGTLFPLSIMLFSLSEPPCVVMMTGHQGLQWGQWWLTLQVSSKDLEAHVELISAPDTELLLVQACGFGRVNHPLGLPFL